MLDTSALMRKRATQVRGSLGGATGFRCSNKLQVHRQGVGAATEGGPMQEQGVGAATEGGPLHQQGLGGATEGGSLHQQGLGAATEGGRALAATGFRCGNRG